MCVHTVFAKEYLDVYLDDSFFQLRVSGAIPMDFLELYFEKPRPAWVIPNGDFPREPPVQNNGVFFSRPTDHSLRLPKWDGNNMEFKFRYH